MDMGDSPTSRSPSIRSVHHAFDGFTVMSPNMKLAIKVYTVSLVVSLVVLCLMGCAPLPTWEECAGDSKCEDKIIANQEYKHRKALIKAQREACLVPYWWDDRSERCRQPLMRTW